MKKINILLYGIILLALILRFWQLGKNPPGLFFDEMALGYNAYSILETGKDEHGTFLPLVYFSSFGDYKPPGYVYLSVPFVKIFGLNPFSIRFASALFGVLTVVLTYFLVLEIFKKDKHKQILALISSFILAVSPWHVFLSRIAYEANLATFFLVLSIYLFLKSFKRKFLLSISCLSALLAMYTFNSARLAVPLIFLGFIIYFYKRIIKNKINILISFLLVVVFFYGLIPHMLSPEGKIRFNEVNIFSDQQIVIDANRRISEDSGVFWAKIIHNRRVEWLVRLTKHYFDNFDLNFLFLSGDVNPNLNNQETGQMYLIELPFFIVGIFLLLKKRNREKFIIFYWLLASILPAATARETPHALRSEVALPTLQIIVSLGIVGGYKLVKNNFNIDYKKYAIVTSFLYIISILYFSHNLFVHYPKQLGKYWFDGYDQAVKYAYQNQEKYKLIEFEELGRSYIAFLVYNNYNPKLFQDGNKQYVSSSILSGNLLVTEKLDKYQFYIDNNNTKPALAITRTGNLPQGFKRIAEFKDLNGEVVFEAGENL